jgi:hypothetical protein
MGLRPDSRRRVGVALTASALLAGGLAAAIAGGGDRGRPSAVRAGGSALAPPGTPARFAYLARQRSNRCDLQAPELMQRRGRDHLQGSCCSAMDKRAYVEQVGALRGYARIRQIPSDPYDIPVALVRRLLRYQAGIRLSARERSVYTRGMQMSREKGPCCCRCWRWTAFEGLSKYLIASRGWHARRLAGLIEALDGCGGGHGGGAGHAGRAPPWA